MFCVGFFFTLLKIYKSIFYNDAVVVQRHTERCNDELLHNARPYHIAQKGAMMNYYIMPGDIISHRKVQ